MLHQVEKILHESQPCDIALGRIVTLCQEHLGVGGAWLVIPGKHIAIVGGSTRSPREVELLCDSLLEETRNPAFDHNSVNQRGDLIWLAVQSRGQGTQGIFALTDFTQSDFSERRLSRVARYIGSHIDSLIDRDYDVLTGLMSWPVFERTIAAAITEDNWREHSVMSFDIDRLHVINDSFGRDSGDEVLKRFAGLLREVLPEHPVTRALGDNFTALLLGIPTQRKRGGSATRSAPASARMSSYGVTRPTGRRSASAWALWRAKGT